MPMYVDKPPVGRLAMWGPRALEQGDLPKDLPVPALPGAHKWVHKLTASVRRPYVREMPLTVRGGCPQATVS